MNRIDYIDTTRGFALILVLLSHGLLQFASNVELVHDNMDWVRLLTRTASPTFMVLFGVMIELVYLRKLRGGVAIEQVRTRLLERMLACYVLLLLGLLAGALTGKISFGFAFGVAVFFASDNFGPILQIYTVLIALTVATLSLGLRFGSVFYAAVAVLAWLLKFALEATQFPFVFPLQYLAGYGEGFGPAILPGVTFVAFGVLIGELISGRKRRVAMVTLIAMSIAALSYGTVTFGAETFEHTLVNGFRWTNSPYYYAFGLVGVSVCLVFFRALDQIRPDPLQRVSVTRLGQDSLFVFGFGNVLINLLPEYHGNSPGGLAIVATYIGAVWAASIFKPGLNRIANLVTAGRASMLYQTYTRSVGQIVALLSGSAFRAHPK